MSKYAFVTGGSRGIGRAVCVKLAQMGFCVIVNYVSNYCCPVKLQRT